MDGRATGLSDAIPEGRLPTLEERIDDMKAVLDAVTAERVALVSFADSGPLCCLFAATYPGGRTLALVLRNTSPRMAWAPDHPWGIDRTNTNIGSPTRRHAGAPASSPTS